MLGGRSEGDEGAEDDRREESHEAPSSGGFGLKRGGLGRSFGATAD